MCSIYLVYSRKMFMKLTTKFNRKSISVKGCEEVCYRLTGYRYTYRYLIKFETSSKFLYTCRNMQVYKGLRNVYDLSAKLVKYAQSLRFFMQDESYDDSARGTWQWPFSLSRRPSGRIRDTISSSEISQRGRHRSSIVSEPTRTSDRQVT